MEAGVTPTVPAEAGDGAVHILVDQKTERARPGPGTNTTFKDLTLGTCFCQPGHTYNL